MNDILKDLQTQLKFYETKKAFIDQSILRIKDKIDRIERGVAMTGDLKEDTPDIQLDTILKLPNGYLRDIIMQIFNNCNVPLRCVDIVDIMLKAKLNVEHYSRSNSLLSTIKFQLDRMVRNGLLEKKMMMDPRSNTETKPKAFFGKSSHFLNLI